MNQIKCLKTEKKEMTVYLFADVDKREPKLH